MTIPLKLPSLILVDFNFYIINFSYHCSNIPSFPAYGVYISHLNRYARAGTNYSDFLDRHKYLRNRLLNQGYEEIRIKRSLTKFFFGYQSLVDKHPVSSKTMSNDCLFLSFLITTGIVRPQWKRKV